MSDEAVIRDRGYSGYDGPRTLGRAAYTLAAHTARAILARTGPKRAVWIAALAAIIAGVVIYVGRKVGGAGFGASYPIWLLTNPAGVVLPGLLIALTAAGGTIAEDQRSGAFSFYFARPLNPRDYLHGRLGGVFAAMLTTLALPPTALALYRAVLCDNASDVLRALAIAVFVAVLSTLVALAVSIYALMGGAVSASRGGAQSFIAIVFVLPWMVAGIATKVLSVPWVSLISLPHLVEALGTPVIIALGGASESGSFVEVVLDATEGRAGAALPPMLAALALFAIVGLGYVFVRARVETFGRAGGERGGGS